MKIQYVGPHDYDGLRPSDKYPFFVVEFQDGFWARDICPPYDCEGYKFNRLEFEEALEQIPGVLLVIKPGTRRHPEIRAYFISDKRAAEQLRARYRKPHVRMEPCAIDGTCDGLRGTDGHIVCDICGGPGYKWKAPRDVM